MVRVRFLALTLIAAAASPLAAQDVLPPLDEPGESPPPGLFRPVGEDETPPPSAEALQERLETALRAAAETRAAIGEAPAEAAAGEGPLRLVPEEVNFAKVYPDGKQARYLVMRVWLVNTTGAPVTVRREAFRLAARGQELPPGGPPRQGLRQIPLGRHSVDLEEFTKGGPVTVPGGEAAGVTLGFFGLPGVADVPAMTLRLPVGGQTVELDLNEYALGLMRLGVERVGPKGLLGVLTVRGEITPVGAGGLVGVLDELAAGGATRVVIGWDAAAPPVHPELSNWLVQAATKPAGVPLNDGQHPALPANLRELHLAAIPDGTGVPSLPGERHVHATVAQAALAAVGQAYDALPVAELLREIEAGHPLTRPAAVAAGGRLPDEKLLLELTGDADVEIAKAAVHALREFGSDEAVGRLAELAETGPEPVRFAAVEGLAASRFAAAHEALRELLDASATGPPVIPPEALVPVLAGHPRPLWGDALYRLATTGDAAVRAQALEALAKLRRPDSAAAFEAALAAEDERLRAAAFRLLVRGRDAASEELALRFTLHHLESEPPSREMYGLLQRTKDPRAVPLLLKHLDARGPNRSDLIRLLARIGGREVREALEAAYPQLDRPAQAQTLAALAQMQSPKLYDFAAAALRSNDPALINTAAQQLQADGGPEAVRLLAAALFESDQPAVLTNAANALAAIGTPEARAALRKATRSDDARGRIAASAWAQLLRQSAGWDSYIGGYTASQQEDWDVAARRYSDAVELDPQFVEAWAGRANAHMQLADYAAARADYERTLELDPSDAAAVTCLGILRVMDGKADEGLAFVRERAAGFEKSDLFAYNTACLYAVAADRLDKGDAARAARLRSDAVKELGRAVELGMTDPDDIDWMTKDPDLESLREREDFKKVVAEARAAAERRAPEQ